MQIVSAEFDPFSKCSIAHMKNFNICVIQPTGYVHSEAFSELSELLFYSLKELGYAVNLVKNYIDRSALNICIGIHLLDPSYIKEFPKNSVLINTEQLSGTYSGWNKNVRKWFESGLELWDYSDRNIDCLRDYGISNIKKLEIGFQKELRRISRNNECDVDVLFYGSINERRNKILTQLCGKGLVVKSLFGVYGNERDSWIKRSKVVLNHHFYASEIFEVVRVFYLLSNSIAVVGEVNEFTQIEKRFEDGIWRSTYVDLVDKTVELLKSDKLRLDLEEKAFVSISKYPQCKFMREII